MSIILLFSCSNTKLPEYCKDCSTIGQLKSFELDLGNNLVSQFSSINSGHILETYLQFIGRTEDLIPYIKSYRFHCRTCDSALYIVNGIAKDDMSGYSDTRHIIYSDNSYLLRIMFGIDSLDMIPYEHWFHNDIPLKTFKNLFNGIRDNLLKQENAFINDEIIFYENAQKVIYDRSDKINKMLYDVEQRKSKGNFIAHELSVYYAKGIFVEPHGYLHLQRKKINVPAYNFMYWLYNPDSLNNQLINEKSELLEFSIP